MTDMHQEMMSKLAEPFDPEDISWRVGHASGDKSKGMALAYIDARVVMERLDRVVGPARWRNRVEITGARPNAGGGGDDRGGKAKSGRIVLCTLEIKLGDEWVGKCDGAGDTAVEAEKGSISDALKRAAVLWGIGRYLYGFPSPWVALVASGRSYAIAKDEHAKLDHLARKALAEYRANPVLRVPVVEAPPAPKNAPRELAPTSPAISAPQPAPKAAPTREPGDDSDGPQDPELAAISDASSLDEARMAFDVARGTARAAGNRMRIVEAERLFATNLVATLGSMDRASDIAPMGAFIAEMAFSAPDVTNSLRKAFGAARARLGAS